MKDGDVRIVMNVYYNPVAELRDLIEKNKSVFVPVIGGAVTNKFCTDVWCDSNLMKDNEGADNISELNHRYNEWTSVYWYWKNRLEIENPLYIGYNHYRRYFPIESISDLENFDIITSKPLPMAFCTPSTGTVNCDIEYAYKVFHNTTDWLEMELEMAKRGYDLYAWKRLGYMPHPCNMFIMKRALFEGFCEFMFSILETLNPKINTEGRDNYQKRAMAFLSERLLSYWVWRKRLYEHVTVKEIDNIFKPEWKNNFLNERGTY